MEWSCHDDGKTTTIDGNGKEKSLVTIIAFVLSFVRGREKEKTRICKNSWLAIIIGRNYVVAKKVPLGYV